ncbi:TA system VapC family ribonuclease toxin [Svornostia abyssi]|uniref:TA system VapC family ribonuclease toxin n=1 Tax=Svornostia abyssi TaxID=2898438 RepID=UPI00338E90F4
MLVYASDQGSPYHGEARALIERLWAGPDLVHLFWPVILGYRRIVTHPGILGRPPSAVEADANIRALLEPPHIRTPSEGDGFWAIFEQTAAAPGTVGNHVPDAHLVALMRQHGVRVIHTRDRDFRRYDGIESRDPFAA